MTLHWLGNTESDVAGYRIYMAPCASGSSCPYDRVGTTTATSFQVTGLTNSVTRYFAVAAVDLAGNESALSYETIFDTPRPAGFGAAMSNFVSTPAFAGWDFSVAHTVAYNAPSVDVWFGDNGSVKQLFGADNGSVLTGVQDVGFVNSLDDVDFAPTQGWSPTGTAELIIGHAYIVWTLDDHYAKLRVTGFSSGNVIFDWAYQADVGNRELFARPSRGAGGARSIPWIRGGTAQVSASLDGRK